MSAEVNSVGFTATGSLSIAYTKINKRWMRASGGKIINSEVPYA